MECNAKNEKNKNANTASTTGFSSLTNDQQQFSLPPYFQQKKTFLQVFISLDILSWILFDLFVQYYAEQLVRLNTNVQVDTDQFYHLKAGAINLLLGVSLPALLIQITGLCGVSSESSCLMATYIFGQIVGCSTMLLLACGNSPISWYWSASALWSALLGATTYLFRREAQQTKQRKKIEQLSEELKV